MGKRGFALAEVLVVLTIIAILAAVAALDFRKWVVRSSVERQIKEMHADLMTTRLQAMDRNRFHFVVLSAEGYTIKDDRDDNGLSDGSDAVVVEKEGLKHRLQWSGVADPVVTFNKRGLSRDNKTVCIYSDAGPAYDCLVISTARINLGRIKDQSSRCLSTNCIQK